MQSGDHDLGLLVVKWVWEQTVPRKDHRAFHQVLQLADVSRPRIPLKGSHGFRRNAIDLLPHPAAKQLHEMRNKSRNVFPALSQRRQEYREDIQTIVQVTAKLPARDHLDETPIACRDQADIHFVRVTAA